MKIKYVVGRTQYFRSFPMGRRLVSRYTSGYSEVISFFKKNLNPLKYYVLPTFHPLIRIKSYHGKEVAKKILG